MNIFGIQIELIPREQAARELMEREITIKWQPLIVEEKIETNIVDLKEVRKRKTK